MKVHVHYFKGHIPAAQDNLLINPYLYMVDIILIIKKCNLIVYHIIYKLYRFEIINNNIKKWWAFFKQVYVSIYYVTPHDEDTRSEIGLVGSIVHLNDMVT